MGGEGGGWLAKIRHLKQEPIITPSLHENNVYNKVSMVHYRQFVVQFFGCAMRMSSSDRSP